MLIFTNQTDHDTDHSLWLEVGGLTYGDHSVVGAPPSVKKHPSVDDKNDHIEDNPWQVSIVCRLRSQRSSIERLHHKTSHKVAAVSADVSADSFLQRGSNRDEEKAEDGPGQVISGVEGVSGEVDIQPGHGEE